MARIFISHSSHDNLDAADIKTWLAARGFSLIFLDFDKENGIEPGADWEKTLYREVDRAQALVLILTQNWLASKWCFAEFTQARALGKEIVPLVLVPDLKTVIGRDLQSINLTVDRAAGLERLEKKLRDLSQHSPEGFELPPGVAPYPGLTAFEENRAAVFYGRDDEIRQGLNRLNRSRTFGSPKLQLLLGASGSGKSSFLRAGLVPRLKRDPTNWIVLSPFRPGRAPEAKLIDCLLLATPHDPAQGAAWRAVLASSAPTQALTEIARALRFQHGALDASIFLPIDQLEEAFTIAGAEDAAKFFDLLTALLDPALPFVVLAALRDDHLDQLQRNANLAVADNVFSLGPMPLERIGALVRGPARMAGLKIDDDLVTTLTQDARTGDALPLIAFALDDLYQRVGQDKAVLTVADYEALGDRDKGIRPLENAVRKRAEEALPDLASQSD
ncbi:hypothetical protein GCM10011497_36810 [Elstera cyanobacteriorum]|uniref:TIR domain-containing protein n=1 Tax=Elstera cyanobacteriorum TaxID=2022747 RepID=A0A255XZQ7_9PROT|nr:toll/interleukin-1 receptor domain-containing protein [Elstera cyanobacteriorum]OYQ22361.1 hypothetical protein CHR90_00390 [Elstera cyanobacteriorum]GGA02783.1 hypothetical protein GCM10011497_36810 [Elstera cyanobacteriorum]